MHEHGVFGRFRYKSLITGRDLLTREAKEQNAIADACGVVGLGNLERHEAAIRGDHWI